MNIRARLKRISDKLKLDHPDGLDNDPFLTWLLNVVEVVYEAEGDERERKLERMGEAPKPTTYGGQALEAQLVKAYGNPVLNVIINGNPDETSKLPDRTDD
jgi:hypothetical protein